MILKSIDLHNYRQHKDLTVDFTGNLIAVVGRNGSGKSNFLGAIQFALTGEQPGFNKEDLLTWGEESGYVKLEFVHEGKDCSITRKIEKPTVTFVIGDEKVTGAAKVKEALELHGIDKDVLRQSVFVRQTEIESCLFTDPRERELAFQKLIGLGDAAKHNKFLVDFLTAADKPKDMSEELERNIAARDQQIETQKRLKAQSEEIAEKLSKIPDDTEARKKVTTLQGRIQLVQNVISLMGSAEAAQSAFAAFLEKNENVMHQELVSEKELQDRIESLQSELASAKASAEFNRVRADARKKYSEAQATVQRIGDLTEKIREFDANNQSKIEKSSRRKELEKLLKDAPDGNVCPLCGSTTDHNIREELERELAAVTAEESRLASWCAASTVYRDKMSKDLAEKEMERWSNEIKRLGPDKACRSEKDVESEITEAKLLLDQVRQQNDVVRAIQFEGRHLQEAHEAAGRALDASLGMLPRRDVTKEQLETVVSKMNDEISGIFEGLRTLSDFKTQKASLDGAIQQIDATIATTEAAIERIREIQKENAIKEDRLKVVTDVKDWFAYRNGPRVMTQAIMSLLTEETNRFLGQFGTPFNVVPMEEGMGFRCVFNDGRTLPNPPPEAGMLSGGQKIALAVAFRFAVYSMFAGKLGLLSLDEPTAYLDDETIGRFADMLGKIKELAQNMNLQVLVSTHEAQLRGAFDQTVEIGS